MTRSSLLRHSYAGFRAYRCTGRPSTYVATTRVRRSPRAAPANGSRSSTTRSASSPGREHARCRRGGSRQAAPRGVRRERRAPGPAPARAGTARRPDPARRRRRFTATWIAASGSGRATPASRCRPRAGPRPRRGRRTGTASRRPLRAEERQRQLGHLRRRASPTAPACSRSRRARRSGGDVVGVRRPGGARRGAAGAAPFAARAASNASSASRTARSPIACTCTWKPSASSARDGGRSSAGSTKDSPALAVCAPQPSRYGCDIAAV